MVVHFVLKLHPGNRQLQPGTRAPMKITQTRADRDSRDIELEQTPKSRVIPMSGAKITETKACDKKLNIVERASLVSKLVDALVVSQAMQNDDRTGGVYLPGA